MSQQHLSGLQTDAWRNSVPAACLDRLTPQRCSLRRCFFCSSVRFGSGEMPCRRPDALPAGASPSCSVHRRLALVSVYDSSRSVTVSGGRLATCMLLITPLPFRLRSAKSDGCPLHVARMRKMNWPFGPMKMTLSRPPILRLVTGGAIFPDLAIAIDIGRSDGADFVGAAACEPLQLHHVSDDA